MARSQTRAILAKALKARLELAAELAAVDRVIQVCREQLRTNESPSIPQQGRFDLNEPRTSRAAHAAYVAELIEAARRILTAEMRPMKRGEIIKRLEEEGYEIQGSDKNRVFGTNMWRSGKFITVQGYGYWPADLELPDL